MALSAVRLFCYECGNGRVMLDVEGTKSRGTADGAGGNQSIEQAQSVREMAGGKIRQSPTAIRLGGPNDGKRRNQFQRLLHVLGTRRILDQFHDRETGYERQVGQAGKPSDRRFMAPLNVDQDVRVQQVHSRQSRTRRSACLRTSRAWDWLLVMSGREPTTPCSRQ